MLLSSKCVVSKSSKIFKKRISKLSKKKKNSNAMYVCMQLRHYQLLLRKKKKKENTQKDGKWAKMCAQNILASSQGSRQRLRMPVIPRADSWPS